MSDHLIPERLENLLKFVLTLQRDIRTVEFHLDRGYRLGDLVANLALLKPCKDPAHEDRKCYSPHWSEV